jgi:cystathionine beta-synthase
MAAGLRPQVIAKLEVFNPGGSIKDRIAVALIEAAERDGRLAPGGTIVEPTSGNTGTGLAIAARLKGYRVIAVMPDKMSKEKIDLLRAYGAEVVVAPTDVPPDSPQSYYRVADRLTEEIPGAFQPNQYFNPANPQAHYESTGPELWEQTAGQMTHLVCGVGTGGTVTGTVRYLRERRPDLEVIGADPEGSIYSGGGRTSARISWRAWARTSGRRRSTGRWWTAGSPSLIETLSLPPGDWPGSRASWPVVQAGWPSTPRSPWPPRLRIRRR